jgi:hypothetical protein
MLAGYLSPEEIKEVKAAFHFGDEAHLGQYRQSGEPYITHPVAVAETCAGWKLDAQSIMAALLHDVMEDQGVTKAELAERFGAKVAELVDGLSKLDKMEFRNREEAQAENFRKMLLAMARDVRVILVKLADRLHNMRTLGAVPPEKRRRVARETLDIYAPIAHRLGLNNTYRELQDLSFANFNPNRYATLEKAVKAARGNRREVVGKILESVQRAIGDAHIDAEVTGREQPARDDVRFVLPTLLETDLERLERRRQDEYLHRVAELLFDLLCALPIDFEQHVMAAFHLLFDPKTRGRIVIAVHFRALEKLARRVPGKKVVDRREVVVLPVLLAGTRLSRRVRNR